MGLEKSFIQLFVADEIGCKISPALCIIFNLSMRTGQVPKAWKDAEVVLIFKKGKRTDPGNYRPVSLTSVVSKLMEQLVRQEVLHPFSDNSTLTPIQHGFRAGRSRTSQLLSVMETWSTWVEEEIPFECL